MLIKNGETYSSNYARAAAYFLLTCAQRSDDKSEAAAYDLITGIYSELISSPEKYGLRVSEDVWFKPWEPQKNRTKDVKTIRDSIKKIESLIAELYELAVNGQVQDNSFVLNESCPKRSKLFTAILNEFSQCDKERITLPEGCAKGLKKLAQISNENCIAITDSPIPDKQYLFFSRCVFEPEKNWTAQAFDKGMGADGQLIWLCNELEKRGYKRVDCKDGKYISLDYVKLYGKKEAPLKKSWGDKFHYGIELTYEDLQLEPYYFWLRMPAFKAVLERVGDLPESTAKFICDNTKTCDGCRYCVQTDKTGKRPLAAVCVGDMKKCPYYPSFSMNWRSLSAQMAHTILDLLDKVYEQ